MSTYYFLTVDLSNGPQAIGPLPSNVLAGDRIESAVVISGGNGPATNGTDVAGYFTVSTVEAVPSNIPGITGGLYLVAETSPTFVGSVVIVLLLMQRGS